MKFFKNKKGQAALEFLTTYGWAFLVILIMIGALAYFGVLSPKNLLPERCTFPAGFQCDDFIITEGTTPGSQVTVNVAMRSINDDAITFPSAPVVVAGEGVTTNFNCAAIAGTIGSNSNFTVACTDVDGTFPTAGDKQKLILEVTYQEVGGSFNHVVRGEVMGTIQ